MNVGEKIAAGEKVSLDAFIGDGLWWAALVNLVFLLSLIWTEPWWNTRLRDRATEKVKPRLSLLPIILILAAVVTGLYWRVPYMSHSFGNDEEWAMRRFVHGYYKNKDDGELDYRKVKWKETFFLNTGTNNHVAQSVAARLSLNVRNRMMGEDASHFSEIAVRLPSLVAGLLCIGAVGGLLCLHGAPTAGVVAAWFLALNPWYLRYSVEARGYAFLLLFSILALLALTRAMRSGEWRFWLLFGFFQFLMMWSFAGAIYFATAMNICILLTLQWPAIKVEDRFNRTARWLIANIFSAMLFIQLMGPSIRQLARTLAKPERRGAMGRDWANDVWSHVTAGTRWAMDDAAYPLYLSLQQMTAGSELKFWFFFGLLPLMCVLGVLYLFAKRSLTLWIAACSPWLAAMLAYAHNHLGGNYMFAWYVIFLLIGVAVCIGLAVEFCVARMDGVRHRTLIQSGMAAVFLLSYGSMTHFPRQAMRNHARQPLREVIAAAHGGDLDELGDSGKEVITVAFGTGAHQFRTYDPRIHRLSKQDEAHLLETLKGLYDEAKSTGRRLVVIYPTFAERNNPKLVEFVNESGRFRQKARLRGLEAMFTYRVMESVDLSSSKISMRDFVID
ncbi:MAG: glycosyltransferase family 39 protein [Verrucomicrobiales bacterium]|nr:glycosyltransferase family 39 protein [Verrucomicrobiales bacterium]